MIENDMVEGKGLIFAVQKFSLRDGPGVRTTVFMKGCPLRCEWCCNPESQRTHPEIMTMDMACSNSGMCIAACDRHAISIENGKRIIDWEKCDQCLKCVDACPSGGIVSRGRYISCDELMNDIEQDRPFYRNSGGGVTFSGGEPLVQWQFLLTMLQMCRAKRIHTCLDTSGYASWPILEKVIPYVDLVLFDIKHLDDNMHRKGTGVSNRLILDNLKKIVNNNRLWLRMPVIPNYNDSIDHMEKVGQLAADIGAEKVSLMPYHNLGEYKYQQLGRHYNIDGVKTPSELDMENNLNIISKYAVQVSVGK